MLTARAIDAAEAEELGLVVEVVPAQTIVDRALDLAQTPIMEAAAAFAEGRTPSWR